MIVGEGPSEADDGIGEPFSGPSGHLLNRWLASLDLTRDQVWLTNVVRCRPAVLEGGRLRNRPPRAPEVAACQFWMDTELRLVNPVAVLCVGATPGRSLVGPGFKMNAHRGQWFSTGDGVSVLVTYNPAYILRLEGDARAQAEAAVALDLGSVRDRLNLG
jgi:DNA polymerase